MRFGPHRGRGYTLRLFEFLQAQPAAGQTNLNAALRGVAFAARRPGLAVLISDLFSPGGYRDGLTALLGRGYEVAVLHILAPEEVDPPLAGDLRLVDVETGAEQEVTLDGALRGLYRRRVQGWRDENAALCRQLGAHFVSIETDEKWEEVALTGLRKQGLVR